MLLHGWPYDIHSFVEVAPMLAASGYRVIVPQLRGHGRTRFLSGAAPRNGLDRVEGTVPVGRNHQAEAFGALGSAARHQVRPEAGGSIVWTFRSLKTGFFMPSSARYDNARSRPLSCQDDLTPV